MFEVNDRVIVNTGWFDRYPGVVKEVELIKDVTIYWVHVDDYSDTSIAHAINALEGLEHGYVPFLEEQLNV